MSDQTPKLTDKDALFVESYLIDLNAREAYRRVFPQSKNGDPFHWLRKPAVQQAITERLSETLLRLGISTETTLREIARNAFLDIRKLFNPDGTMKRITDLTADEASSITSFEIEEVKSTILEEDLCGNMVETDTVKSLSLKKVKLADRFKYLELLVKYQKLIVDKLEITGANGGAVQVNLYIPDNKRGEQ